MLLDQTRLTVGLLRCSYISFCLYSFSSGYQHNTCSVLNILHLQPSEGEQRQIGSWVSQRMTLLASGVFSWCFSVCVVGTL